MLESVPRWVRVSAVILVVGISSEVLYELYLGWKAYCEQRRARQRAASHINEVYFTNERNTPANAPGTTMASFTTEHVSRIVALLDRARVSENLGMYIITVSSIGDALPGGQSGRSGAGRRMFLDGLQQRIPDEQIDQCRNPCALRPEG